MAANLSRKHSILFVDDDTKILELMTAVFLSENYTVVTKSSGEEGLEYIQENKPVSVVISDFRMEGMNGLEFLKRVKIHSPGTKRYLCTGYFDRSTLEQKVKDNEIDTFMIKPVDFKELLITVDTLAESFEKNM